MTRAGKVTVPIRKSPIQKMCKNLKVQFKTSECTAHILAWIILEEKSVHVLAPYLRCVHKLWNIKKAKYYPQRSTRVNINGYCVRREKGEGKKKKRFSSLGAARSNGLMWRVETQKIILSQYIRKHFLESKLKQGDYIVYLKDGLSEFSSDLAVRNILI